MLRSDHLTLSKYLLVRGDALIRDVSRISNIIIFFFMSHHQLSSF